MERVDRWLWTVIWVLQVAVWITNYMAHGTQNGSALIAPALWLVYCNRYEIFEDLFDVLGLEEQGVEEVQTEMRTKQPIDSKKSA